MSSRNVVLYSTKNSCTVVTPSRRLMSGRLRRTIASHTRRIPPKREEVPKSATRVRGGRATSGMSGWRVARIQGRTENPGGNLNIFGLTVLGYPRATIRLGTLGSLILLPVSFEHSGTHSQAQQAYCISFGRKHDEIKVCQGRWMLY